MDASREILVSIDIEKKTFPVGKLWFHNRKGRQSSSFEYEKTWLSNPQKFALEPALTLAEGNFHTGEKQFLFGSIGDSAPDRWGRLLMQRANETSQAFAVSFCHEYAWRI